MAQVKQFSTDLLTANAAYLIAFSWLLGQSIWQSFFGGVIAHKSLTRQSFSVLQAKLFPVYFSISAALSTVLLGIWSMANWKDIQGNYLRLEPAVVQAYDILFVTLLSLLNWFWIGPVTNQIIVARQRLEKAEGRPYYDKGSSSKMKALNKRFGMWHGISSLANLLVIIALLYHGLWYANYGLTNDFSKVTHIPFKSAEDFTGKPYTKEFAAGL